MFTATESFAASGWSSSTINTKSKTVEKDQKEVQSSSDDDTNDEERAVENKNTEKNAQKIILEVYKIQGNKILKDM